MTTSTGQGCGYVAPHTDIMLNNMLGEADLNPLGFHRWQENRRITSMMSPTIVFQNQKPFASMGSGGANRIRSAILQVVLNAIEFGLTPQECVNNSRLHWDADVLNIEPNFEEKAIQTIQLPNEQQRIIWQSQNMFFGGVNSVFINQTDGSLTGIPDSRRAGVSLSTE
jgi:gamma-glutamyltranspeptidase/glutathione hydrolase